MTWATGPGGPDPVTRAQGLPDDPLAARHVQPAAIHEKAARHTGGDVWLVATGPGSEAFHGRLDNTRIHDLIAGAIAGKTKPASR
jgi:alkaline phosphatase